MLLRISCGDAEDEDGRRYELGTTTSGAPCIRGGTTGKYFVVPWGELIDMAIEAGIDTPDATS